MGRQKMLYLSDRAYGILEKLENASQFVTKLIEGSSPAILKEIKEETAAKVEVIEKEIEKIDIKHKEEKEIQKITQETKEQKLKEKKANVFQFLKEGIARDPTNEEIDEYLDLFEKGETNPWKFIEELRNRDFKPLEDEDDVENKS